MTIDVWRITWFTALAAAGATALVLPPGVALAWALARREFFGRNIVETIASLPLVMPPVATGLILLWLVGRRGPIGAALASQGIDVVFTWKAVVLAMACIGFPLLVRTARTGFEQVSPRYEQLAATLGASPLRIFFTVTVPLALRPILAGALLTFSRAIGEFGATVLVAGSIPGRTETLAVAIFNRTQVGEDRSAAVLVGVSVVIAFAAISASNTLLRRRPDERRA